MPVTRRGEALRPWDGIRRSAAPEAMNRAAPPRAADPAAEEAPLPLRCALEALARCASRTAVLLARGRLRQPTDHVGERLSFADGTTAAVYRETAVERPAATAPAVLVVSFRLRRVRSERAHGLFRLESVLNTVLFAGFPGLVSKLWLRHDAHGTYRGLYEWDDPALAVSYVRALWWALVLVSVRDSIHYVVVPGLHRDDVLRHPERLDAAAPGAGGEWWRLASSAAAAA